MRSASRSRCGSPNRQGFLDRRTEAVDMTAGQCRNVDLGRPLELDQVALDLSPQVAATFVVGQVPLVERDHQRTPCLLHRCEDAEILFGERLTRVDDHHAHLRALDGTVRTQAGVVLVPGLLDPAANPAVSMNR